ncbi:MAG TPA: ATP-dependent sacrificial sulfur transferase LarE [Candidatus Acidoferrales bacterium]|nr:ATP-dependent sacrificial sulfur transferase LarE [Candidatus Acidoferrales bacterium]
MRNLAENTTLKEIQQIKKTGAPNLACAELGQTGESRRKQERMIADLRKLDSLLIAFSGGADSAYLAWAAHQALGVRALAVTALSPSFSQHDREEAERFAAANQIPHECIRTEEFENPLYVANQGDRCYHCKDELFEKMARLAQERGFAAIAYGINADDTHEFRPGHRAAAEHQILAPLLTAALTKKEIRALSREAGLATWDRPAAACLSSRVAYGTKVTPELLARIERGETFLRELGFRQFRLRAHGELARVEIAPDELPRALDAETAQRIARHLKSLGFIYVTLDLEGYRTGSLNASLKSR